MRAGPRTFRFPAGLPSSGTGALHGHARTIALESICEALQLGLEQNDAGPRPKRGGTQVSHISLTSRVRVMTSREQAVAAAKDAVFKITGDPFYDGLAEAAAEAALDSIEKDGS